MPKIIAPRTYERMKDMALLQARRRGEWEALRLSVVQLFSLFPFDDRREKSERIEIVWISIEAFGQKFLIGNFA